MHPVGNRRSFELFRDFAIENYKESYSQIPLMNMNEEGFVEKTRKTFYLDFMSVMEQNNIFLIEYFGMENYSYWFIFSSAALIYMCPLIFILLIRNLCKM